MKEVAHCQRVLVFFPLKEAGAVASHRLAWFPSEGQPTVNHVQGD